jgi:Leucine-rich repeat (LRR) protein
VLRQERKTKKQMQGQGSEIQTDDAESLPGVKKDDAEMVQVRAFPEASSVQVLSSNTEATTVFPVLNARVVNKEEPALPVPILEDSVPTERTELLKALLQSRKCRIISFLAIMLGVGVIVAVVLLTQNGSKASPSTTSATLAPTVDKATPLPTPAPVSPITPTRNPTKKPTSAPVPTRSPTKNAMSSSTFLAELKPLLSNESLTALNNPDSPQSQSIQWLLEKSNFQDWSFQRQVQRFAMATIYYATGGPSWSNGGGNWLTNATECGWFQGGSQGNFCNNKEALVSLEQYGNELKGTIPDEIGLLTSLNYINLGDNTLSGTVPTVLGSLTALTRLYLFSNSFNGTVPSQLGVLTSLNGLSLYFNSFTGTVPSQIGSLTALTLLSLSGNSFTGTVPSELGSLTALTWLNLGINSFKGTMPSQLGSLTALTELDLSSNSFTGTVPSQLGYLTALLALYLSSNSFTGTVPSQLGSLTTLAYLNLSSNSLTGTVPSQLGSLTALTELYLYTNSFTGTVPSQLGALTALHELDLYDNVGLIGTVPAKLCNLGQPVSMYVDCNPGPQCSCCGC